MSLNSEALKKAVAAIEPGSLGRYIGQDVATAITTYLSALPAGDMEPNAWWRDDSFVINFSRGPRRPPNATSSPDEWKPLYDASAIQALNEECRLSMATIAEERARAEAAEARVEVLIDERDGLMKAQPDRVDAARNFPKNTCPASRHVQMIGEALAAREKYMMIEEDPEYVGASILSVVASLYESRAALSASEARAKELGKALRPFGDVADWVEAASTPSNIDDEVEIPVRMRWLRAARAALRSVKDTGNG